MKIRSILYSLYVPFLVAVYLLLQWQSLPEQISMGWDFKGEVLWKANKIFLWLVLSLTIGLTFLSYAIPKIDPRKENYTLFIPTVNTLVFLMNAYVAVVVLFLAINGLGISLNILLYLPVIAFILLALIGNYLGKLKPNYMFGIKTPWTLKYEKVWIKTHRFTAKLWVFAGIAGIVIHIVFQNILFFVIYLILLTLLPLFVSYIMYKQYKSTSKISFHKN